MEHILLKVSQHNTEIMLLQLKKKKGRISQMKKLKICLALEWIKISILKVKAVNLQELKNKHSRKQVSAI